MCSSDLVKATEEACKRQALDDFMHDIRIEERSYVRETKQLETSRRAMVMQERIFFRNIPLSNWIEHEMLIEEGRDLSQLPKESVFVSGSLPTTRTTSGGACPRSRPRMVGRLPALAPALPR